MSANIPYVVKIATTKYHYVYVDAVTSDDAEAHPDVRNFIENNSDAIAADSVNVVIAYPEDVK